MTKTLLPYFLNKNTHHKKTSALIEFLQKTSSLITHCKKHKTIQPILEISESIRAEMVETAFLLSEQWSELFLFLIAQKNIDDLLALEDILQESAHRGVLEALKNLLDLSIQGQDSNLRLYKLRRIYYQISTYFSENETMISYEISLYHPPLSLLWIHSLEDLA